MSKTFSHSSVFRYSWIQRFQDYLSQPLFRPPIFMCLGFTLTFLPVMGAGVSSKSTSQQEERASLF